MKLSETETELILRELIRRIGDDPDRTGLFETPGRIIKSWNELFSGYKFDDQKTANMLKVFKEDNCDEMVIVKGIPFYSMCEHHMLPFLGEGTIAYIPKGQIIGLSKLPRLLEVYSRRLTVQERITNQVADALMQHVNPKGAACLLSAEHLCMACRGVNKAGSETLTSALRGCFKDDSTTRSEFIRLATGG